MPAYEGQLTYERLGLVADVVNALRQHLEPGERIIWRAPYRWMTVDGVISNGYESQSADSICEDNGWEVVHDFYHVAVVRPLPPKVGP